jgi:EmrB/QacA subfamily drug resistance transporter
MKRPWLGFAGILLGMSTSVLMQTLVATAMPTIADELGGLSLYSWVFGAYMLASTVTIPLFAKLADLLGRRSLYLAGLFTFLAGSALAGTAASMPQLVLFRVLQGIGAGAVAPAALAAVGDLFSESGRGRVFGLIGAVQVLATLVGPVAGGWITDVYGWRWGFFFVLPLGGLAALAAALGLSAGATATGPDNAHWLRQLDWQGAGLLGGALCAALLGLQAVAQGGGGYLAGAATLALAGLLFRVALRWEQNHADPTLPLALLRQSGLGRATLGTLLLGAASYGAIAYVPLYVQGTEGGTATAAGMALLPMMAAAGAGSGLGGWLGGRWPRPAALLAWCLVGAACLSLALLPAAATTAVRLAFVLIGLGVGLLLPVFLEAAQRAAGANQRAAAAGAIQLARNVGGAAGVTLLGIWLSSGLPFDVALPAIFACLGLVAAGGLLLEWQAEGVRFAT